MTAPPPCKGCKGDKPARVYLCQRCWWTLQPATRRALSKRGDLAMRRLSDLYDALGRDVPLNEIKVTP